jgi:hypothetical protein
MWRFSPWGPLCVAPFISLTPFRDLTRQSHFSLKDLCIQPRPHRSPRTSPRSTKLLEDVQDSPGFEVLNYLLQDGPPVPRDTNSCVCHSSSRSTLSLSAGSFKFLGKTVLRHSTCPRTLATRLWMVPPCQKRTLLADGHVSDDGHVVVRPPWACSLETSSGRLPTRANAKATTCSVPSLCTSRACSCSSCS